MELLGPQTLTLVHEDGDKEKLDVFVRIIGSSSVPLGDGIMFDLVDGEILFRYEDGEERAIPVSAPNSLAMIGTAFMIAEAETKGLCSRENAAVYRHLLGDIKGPGDMFR
jgi:hypothetical protein